MRDVRNQRPSAPFLARSLLLTAPRQVVWVDEELPELGTADVLVQTTAGAISIGSELPHYIGNARHSAPDAFPMMTGYESAGRVVARGTAVTGIEVDQRVVAFYGLRTIWSQPAAKVIPIPDDIDDALGLLAILSCDVMKGIRKLALQAGESVLITGAGTIGMLAIWTLHALGVEHVDVIEPDGERHALARLFGATLTLDPEDARHLGPYDAGLECSSRDMAFGLLQHALRTDGRICILADGNLEPLTLTPVFHERELLIVGSSDGWNYPTHARWFFDAVRRTTVEVPHSLERLYGWHIAAHELAVTFERLATTDRRPAKVLVDYR